MGRIIQESGGERKEFPIKPSLTIGRKRECEIFLDDPKLSREHTRVYFESRGYFVEDLGSRNGTQLNERRIEVPELLRPGDRIRVGTAIFVFQLDPADANLPADVKASRGDAENETDEADPVAPIPLTALPPAREQREGMVVKGPPFFTRLFLWIVLLAIAGGALYGAKMLFVWALKRAMQP